MTRAMVLATRMACDKEGNRDSNKGDGNEGGGQATATMAMAMVMIQPVTGSVTASEPHNIVATRWNMPPK